MKPRKEWHRFYTVLTNGTDSVRVECSRYDCGITPPPGMIFSIKDGEYYLNGQRAWLQLKVEEE